MSFLRPWNSGVDSKKAIASVPETSATSSGGTPSNSRSSSPFGAKNTKNKLKYMFSSSKSRNTTEQISPPATDSTQQRQPIKHAASPRSLIVPARDIPFKEGPDSRNHEVAIYESGIQVVNFLQELAKLTGPGVPNPVPSILEALVGVLTQLKQMVKNEGEWKALFILIFNHLDTFNGQLRLLELGEVTPDPDSALHGPIMKYSSTLQEITAKILDDAGFNPTGQREKSDWRRLADFFVQYWRAGEVPGKIEDYHRQLSNAMDLLLRDHVMFTAIKMEETNTIAKEANAVVKETNATVNETNAGVKEILKIMDGGDVSIGAARSRTVAKSLPAVSPYFVVRKSEMDRMVEYIGEPSTTRQKIFVITGMGGCGKTQMVAYFIQEMNKDKALFTHVVFVDASSEANIKADLQTWVQSTGMGHEQDDWKNALQILSNNASGYRWALIFDSADNPDLAIAPFFPQNGVIIVTSRNIEMGELASKECHLQLAEMTLEQARATLINAARWEGAIPPTEEKAIEELSRELGCLALALVHAGTYCHKMSTIDDDVCNPYSFVQYLSDFHLQPAQLMKETVKQSLDNYRLGVYTTLDLSYQIVPSDAKEFLHILSYFHFSGISMNILASAAEKSFSDPRNYLPRAEEHEVAIAQLKTLFCTEVEWDLVKVNQLVVTLRSFSLISPATIEGSRFLQLHPLVQSWTRNMRIPNMKQYQIMAKQILTSSCFEDNIRSSRYLIPHINDMLKEKKVGLGIHINDQMAFEKVYRNLGHFEDAEKLIEAALQSLTQQSQEETEDMLYVTGRLAAMYINQNRWQEAEVLQLEVLERRRNILPNDHVDIVDAQSNLATIYIMTGRSTEAEELLLPVIDSLQRILGPRHLTTLHAMVSLAVAYDRLGLLKKEEDLEVEILERYRQIGYADHPTAIQAAVNLAITYKQQDKWHDAAPLLVLAVAHSIKFMGQSHRETQGRIRLLMGVYDELGEERKAREMKDLLNDERGDGFE